jgi:hypothetical protein
LSFSLAGVSGYAALETDVPYWTHLYAPVGLKCEMKSYFSERQCPGEYFLYNFFHIVFP